MQTWGHMELRFDTKLRLRLPPTRWPDKQSLYVFNLYRSASSLVVVITRALGEMIHRQTIDVTQLLYKSGTALFDTGLSGTHVSYLADGDQLNQFGNFGGYLLSGFREVPLAYAENFGFHQAALLIVRDPRDIGISQYHAVQRHKDDNVVAGQHIKRLRKQTNELSLEQFILRDQTIDFLNRIVLNYRPMIERGMPVVLYEDFFESGVFDLPRLCATFVDHFEAYLPEDFDFEAFLELVNTKIAENDNLKGHGTGGTIYNYRGLPEAVLEEYTERLGESLAILGY